MSDTTDSDESRHVTSKVADSDLLPEFEISSETEWDPLRSMSATITVAP
jgi:hypothetical protein